MHSNPLSLGLSERLLTALGLLVLVLLLAASGWLWRWDRVLYDLQIDLWSKPPARDIVIVAVDEQSLADFGRWPWPRGLHAQLIDQLSKAGARAIAMDILFAEADLHNPQGDRQLIQAVAGSGRVFLPVIMEQYRLGGQLVETLPMPELANVAAGLGHMHMQLDADGIARGIYLYEGLGEAYWPHMMLALLHWLEPKQWPIKRPVAAPTRGMQAIERLDYRLIPFSGPPGHYPRYSYSQVLKGDFLPDAFKDRIVLVGVTATGLGDVLPTPVSAQNRPMPGVEINANILDALRSHQTITTSTQPVYLLASGLLVLLPFVLYPYFATRLVPVVALTLVLLVMTASLVLLHAFHYWFPPAVTLLGLLISYPLWSWRRLELTVAYLKLELGKLHDEQQVLPARQARRDLSAALEFLQRLMPLRGWALYDRRGRLVKQWGEALETPYLELARGQWRRQGAELWIELRQAGDSCRLGLRWPRTEVPRGRTLALLEDFANRYDQLDEAESTSTLEQVERRIRQVQRASDRLAQLRGFINAALGQMDDGLLVVDSLGLVVLANPRAARYLGREEGATLTGEEALGLLQALQIHSELAWPEVLRRLLLEAQPIRFEALGPGRLELYLQLQPLDLASAGLYGMIVNLSNVEALKQAERTRVKMINFLSHDLRSPITSLLALTQSRQALRGSAAELAQQIQPLARRSLKMADDFLQHARAEAADATSFQDTDFVAVIYNVIGEVYAQAQLRGIRLEQHYEVEEAWLQGNVALLERALLNLLGNAIKFSPRDGVVSIHLARHGDRIECCVQDQGPGISAEQAEEIFQPFHHGEQSEPHQRSGVGLGLSFVKVVAEKHQGRIELRNPGAPGALFCLQLPCEA